MFKHRRTLFGALVLTLAIALAVGWTAGPGARAQDGALAPQAPLGTTFTYQGQLTDGGVPAAGPCDFRFSLYDAAAGGTQIGSPLPRTGVELNDGRFGVNLDFGAGAFKGEARWLEIAVQCTGDADYATLGRVVLTAAPYALYALDANRLDGQQASAFASASHGHLGETWTGVDAPLVISGTFGHPGNAPLVLGNTSPSGVGLRVNSADYGVIVDSVREVGVSIRTAGTPSTTISSEFNNGFDVAGAEGSGLYVGRADLNGVYVVSAGWNGMSISSMGNDGVFVDAAGDDGLHVNSAQDDGVYVGDAGDFGLYVGSAGIDGVYVGSAGAPSAVNSSTEHNGFQIDGAEGSGLYVGHANVEGVYVNSAGDPSTTAPSDAHNGFEVAGAQGYGLYVGRADVGGVYVDEAGLDGVFVSTAGRDGVYANTTDADREWGFNTPDKLYAGAGWAGGGPLTFVAQNGDAGELEPGDAVAGIGLALPFADGPDPVPLVGRANAMRGAGVIGVVLSRFVAEEEVEELETDNGMERHTRFRTHSAEGSVGPGEHMLIVVLGVAQVKVEAGTAVQPGQRLTASDLAGHARALRTETLNGMVVTEGAPVVGVALAAPEPGATIIPVFVTLR